jgi:hypothetical protein
MAWKTNRSKREAPVEGLAGALDDLDRWVEAKLPRERWPLLSALVLGIVRLLTGRLGWLAGAFVLLFAAPMLESVYREATAPVERALWRARTTARAEGRIVAGGFAITVNPQALARARFWEDVAQARPFAVLAFHGPTGEEVRSLYRPAGDRWPARPAGRLGRDLLVFPPELAPGLAMVWSGPEGRGPEVEILIPPALRDEPSTPTGRGYSPWETPPPPTSAAEELLAKIDRPFEIVAREWTAASGGLVGGRDRLDVRYLPGEPERAFPLTAFDTVAGDELATKAFALLMFGAVALLAWWFGAGLIVRGLPRRHRQALTWLPLLLLPWWGARLERTLAGIVPGEGELVRSALVNFSSPVALPLAGPVVWADVGREVWSLQRSEFADLLAAVDLARPEPAPPDVDAAWRAMSERVGAFLFAQPEPALDALVTRLAWDAQDYERPWRRLRLLPAFAEGLRRLSLAEERPPERRDEATRLLRGLLESSWPENCSFAFGESLRLVQRLAEHPDHELRAAATDRLARFHEAVAAIDAGQLAPCE